jgi:hypothetical protein
MRFVGITAVLNSKYLKGKDKAFPEQPLRAPGGRDDQNF